MVKAALVHEWFTTLAGSERVVEQLCRIYPELDLYSVYADPAVVQRSAFLNGRELTTSFIQNMPRAAQHFRNYLLLMPLAVEQFDLSAYDVIISSAHAVAKGVLTGPDQLHVSYVHTPIRYAWDLQHQYLRESGLDHGVKGWMARWMLHKMRIWDYRTAAGVDHFVANSHYIARRIKKVYGRQAHVIYPPVDVSRFSIGPQRDSFYLAVSRLVPYKKMDLIVEAFAATPHRKLVVVGDGPELPKVKAKAAANIEILGYQPTAVVRDLMQRTRALVFAGEEDFGITLVEAQACGAPVIAYGRGGAVETVLDMDHRARPTGVFFREQDVSSLIEAVNKLERNQELFEPENCRASALRFSQERFRQEFEQFITHCRSQRLNGRSRTSRDELAEHLTLRAQRGARARSGVFSSDALSESL